MREVAVQANCLICDAHFLVVVTAVPPASAFSGRRGTQEFEDLLEKIQREASHPLHRFLRCPTCTEIVAHCAYQDWLGSKDEECHLSLCKLYSYAPDSEVEAERLPPLFINGKKPEEKPRWQLAHGIGPKTLEVDRSRSGRLHRPSLKQFGITGPRIPAVEDPASFEYTIESIYSLAEHPARLEAALPLLEKNKPLIHAWDNISSDPMITGEAEDTA
ncbi:hypothetical protein PTSG_03535 [Salpingoeca rosetta]|uniref:Uncharacterized protein n=1 Tax=Salpingoeca rosetta (strain ATCC 50818 / BSB-021) TaxID=946362 RepID=F2U5W2_SALR5|nr:uncharacterized protein PTSG_03535 [Salpingoeca rosetta]EGD82903.1 hypothetical protein PTSG_03535 [Salpingoeca rosetta]|eukprot:XP_004995267.1 hypothetical protein PTSG_03535 [Salpingoeca rosetta]